MARLTRREMTGFAGLIGAQSLLGPDLAQEFAGYSHAGAWAAESAQQSSQPHKAYSRLAFIDDFCSPDTIDMNDTRKEGFDWYRVQWWGNGVTTLDSVRINDSVLQLGGGTGRGRLQSAIEAENARHFIGNVWGGGAYFEIRMQFDPRFGAGVTGGLGVYLFSIEHLYFDLFPADAQWQGQPQSFAHFAELDIMELAGLSSANNYVGRTAFQGTIHDWSGIYDGAPSFRGWPNDLYNSNFLQSVGSVDWTQFHIYGVLWVPQAGSTPGYVRWYFDNKPLGGVYWLGPIGRPRHLAAGEQYKGVPVNQSSPPLAGETFAVLDRQRLAMQLDGNSKWPILVDWVKIWQKP